MTDEICCEYTQEDVNDKKVPLLTIAIPTYNRLEKLKISLEKILGYTKGHDEIEIFVSDNASTDGTKEYVESIQKVNTNLKYYRNMENLGLDGNFLNCFRKAQGKYLWMLSDDDSLMENAVETVLCVIKQNPVMVFCNLCLETGQRQDIGVLDKGDTLFLEDKNDFLKAIGVYITFVSSLIYNMSLVRKINDMEKYKGDNLLLSHVAINIMQYDGTYVLIREHCIHKSAGGINWDFYQAFFYGMKKLIWNTALKSGFDAGMLNRIFYHMLKWPLMDLYFALRRADRVDDKWNKDYLWDSLSDYPDLLQMYQVLVDTPRINLVENFLKVQRMKMAEVIAFCRRYDHVYLYGTGRCAEIFYKYLLEAGIYIQAAIISDGENKKEFHGKNVYYFSELSLDENRDCIVVTPFETTSRRIIAMLKQNGYENNYYENKYANLIDPVTCDYKTTPYIVTALKK